MESITMKKTLILAFLVSCAVQQAHASNIPRFSTRHIPLIAAVATYHYLVKVPARKIKNTFKTIFKPSSVTRYEDNDSCC
jgi:hypothetical protein